MSSSSSTVGQPTSHDQFAAPILGEEAQALISCNQRLQELGIDDTIKLPRIVVTGDQSTGKSSLIEAISTIKVPKAANLCTKCPIAINLSSGQSPSSPWRCTVYTEEKFSFDHTLRQKKSTIANPLGPWQPLPELITTKIKVTDERDELCDLIGLSEKLLLNPRRDRNNSIEVQAAGDTLEKFSPNTIRLDISMGDWPNLSFVDLPGVIQSAGRGQPDYLVDLVASLAKQYARDDNNVIMLTLPMNHDVSNSRSYSIIQKEKAQARTMAIHTKADIARDEERRDCLERYFSEESEEEFAYGNHVVMLRSASHMDLRQVEEEFFAQPPWSHLPIAIQRGLGVTNLTDILRRILFQKTSETLPANLYKIQMRLTQVKHQLEAMPAPPDVVELPYQLREQINIFHGHVNHLFTTVQNASGVPSRSKLMQLMQEFGSRIHRDSPTMIIRTQDEADEFAKAQRSLRDGSVTDPVSVDSDSESSRRTESKSSQGQTPRKNANGSDDRIHRFRLEDIRKLNQAVYQSMIPGETEPRALETMSRQSVQYWDKTFARFMQRVSKMINQEVLGCVKEQFGGQKHLAVYTEIEDAVKEYLDRLIQEEWSNLDKICDGERQQPLTFNEEGIKNAETESLQIRQERRASVRLELACAVHKVVYANKKKVKEPTLDDIGPDPWNVEVRMAAKARAYYEVASRRFIDNICQQIFARLIPRCHDPLIHYVKQHLGLNDITANRQKIALLMSEDRERENTRTRLVNELERLNDGHAYIASVLGTVNGPRVRSPESVYTGAMLSDDPATTPTLSTPDISPNKRKADCISDNTPCTPTKRKQPSNKTGNTSNDVESGQVSTGLLTRLRSCELEEVP